MKQEKKAIILFLIAIAFFTGATIEISEGSVTVGILLFILAAIPLSRIEFTDTKEIKSSRAYLIIGIFVMAIDILYNVLTESSLGTLDSMIFIIGASLVAMSTNRKDLKQLGEFVFYISSIFTALYLVFYTLFGYLEIDFIHLFDHFFVLMPTVALLKIIGIPVDIVAIETITIYGSEPMTIVIGGPCSGLYSMFLLIGIVAGYSRIEKMDIRQSVLMLLFAVAIAYLANLVRVFILYLTAYFYGLDTMSVVHTHLGWIIFAVTAGLIMYLLNMKKAST